MKKAYKHILFLYVYNRSFLVLLGIFLFSAMLSKVLFQGGRYYSAQEIFSMLFVVSLWASFYLGLMLKQQFAHHRASLLPHYRGCHIRFFLVLYVALILVAYMWVFGVSPTLSRFPKILWGIYFTCSFIALLITYLGYLSNARVLIYAYVALLIFSNQAMNFINMLNSSDNLVYIMGAMWVGLLAAFMHRLSTLKEDDFEYHHQLTWPPRRLILNQMRASQSIADLVSPLTRIWKRRKNVLRVPLYDHNRGILSGAFHWDYAQRLDLKHVWVLLLLASPFLLVLINDQSTRDGFDQNVYSNFLLIAISPIVMTIAVHYQRMAYWGYDVLKPVDKQQYMKQQGIILLTSLWMYWVLFALCFALLPSMVTQPELLLSKRFWAYLVLTLIYAVFVLSWLALLCCIKKPVAVIAQGLCLSSVTLFYFYCVPEFTLEHMFISHWALLACSLILCRWAFAAWSEKEFDSK